MAISDQHWHVVSTSPFPWEQEALDYLRQSLPDEPGWEAWPLFEFIADTGALYEVDLLLLSPNGLWLIEIKSQPGALRGNQQTWTFTDRAAVRAIDNPLFLVNRKAKTLRSLLERRAVRGTRVPFVGALVFISAKDLDFGLNPDTRAWVCARDENDAVRKGLCTGIVAGLRTGKFVGAMPDTRGQVSPRDVPNLVQLIQKVLQPASRGERVGDYRFGELLDEGPGYQDWLAKHQTLKDSVRRARCYLVAYQTTKEERERLERAAQREYAVLQGIHHAGIPRVSEYMNTDRGPVLLFEHEPNLLRLDHWLLQHPAGNDATTNLTLLEQLLDAVRAAHSHGLVHRALSPRCVLVGEGAGTPPRLQVANWQSAIRAAEPGHKGTSGTVHVSALVEDAATAYIAPEALIETARVDEKADVFSLGAIAYRLFAGRAAAANHLELTRTLHELGGLKLSAAVNGIPPSLDALVLEATRANPLERGDLQDFAQNLEAVWKELTRPTGGVENPLEAHKDDPLDDDETGERYIVMERLGLGACALALRVKDPKGDIYVMKIARTPDHTETLDREFQTLQRVHDAAIVRVYKRLRVGGFTALLIQDAQESLAVRLRRDGRLHLDLLQRLGEDLLRALDYLEREGVFHRDLKPDNMGVIETRVGRNTRLRLMLFDFSLSTSKIENIEVGTRAYLDPFLALRRPPLYDTQAERYAAGVSLYEMTTAAQPRWGDGTSNPAADKKSQLVLETGLFPSACREDLAAFFEKALNREPKRRFGNAQEMLHAWSALFAGVEQVLSISGEVDSQKAIAEAALDTPVSQLGLTLRTYHALDRVNVLKVRDLLRLKDADLITVRGIGSALKREILGIKQRLKERFPDIEEAELQQAEDLSVTTLSRAQAAGIDHLLEKILGGRSRARDYRPVLLGREEPPPLRHPWPTQNGVAERFKVTRAAVGLAWNRDVNVWKRSSSLNALCDEIYSQAFESRPGAMTAQALAEFLLARRECVIVGQEKRLRSALAVLRAALAVEEARSDARFFLYRREDLCLIATGPELASYAQELGAVADRLAGEWPPATPSAVLQELRLISSPEGFPPLSDEALRSLAVATSRRARLAANRQEIYPEMLIAAKALQLASGALLGAERLTPEEVRRRVSDRFPAAEPLPGRPQLDVLLDGLRLGLQWNEAAGAYTRKVEETSSVSQLSPYRVSSSLFAGGGAGKPLDESSLACQRRLDQSLSDRGFLVIQVENPRAFQFARKALQGAFHQLNVVDLNRLVLTMMREQAKAFAVDWETVLRADAAGREGSEWKNLQQLVEKALPPAEEELLRSDRPLLLVNAGLVARYQRIGLLERLRDATGTRQGPPGCWLLVSPTHPQRLPRIDGVAVPVIGSGQYMTIDPAWVGHMLRANAS